MKNTIPFARIEGVSCEITQTVLNRWDPALRPKAAADATIEILDVIGQDFWSGDGITAKSISARLREIGATNDVVVTINSPGGDMFEGLAIYSALREHKGNVTVKVLGLAASAASIIAMAADELLIARSGFLMIHNAWVVVGGNKSDLRATADMLEPFDAAMADVYAARTGEKASVIAEMMDKESWIGGAAAVDQGFADGLLDSDSVSSDPSAKADTSAGQNGWMTRKLDTILAKVGMPRSERRKLVADLKSGTPRAVGNGEPSAADESTRNAALVDEVRSLSRELKGILS